MKNKNIFRYMTLAIGLVGLFSSCTDDRDSNPTLIEPAAGTFKLFQPEYANSIIDLNNADADYGITLTWNQPKYTSNGAYIGFNAGAGSSYKVMISPSGTFTQAYEPEKLDMKTGVYSGEAFDYVVADEVYGTTKTNVLAKTINMCLNRWNQLSPASTEVWNEGQDIAPLQITVKVLSRIIDGGGNLLCSTESNTITLNVKPYWQLPYEAPTPDPIYMPGNANGWNHSFAPILTWDSDAEALVGWAYMDGEFKFTAADNWTDGEWNCSHFKQELCSSDIVINDGTGNIGFTGQAGMYKLYVNYDKGAITAEPYTWRLVGKFNEWDPNDDTQVLSYDTDEHCLIIRNASVTEDGWKFTSNGNWDLNYGAAGGTNLSELTPNGDNITVVGTTIRLYLENTKTAGDKPHATVE